MTTVNCQIVLRRRPMGEPRPEDFELVESPLAAPRDGEILTRTVYLSLDPYMRGRMNEGRSYTGGMNPALGDVMVGGIDVYFENVGGAVLAAVLGLVNVRARIPLCGLIAQYNATGSVSGPDWRPLLTGRVLVQGFIVSDHQDRMGDFLADCGRWHREGRLKYREDVVQGLEAAPRAFIGLLRGENFGKLLVQL